MSLIYTPDVEGQWLGGVATLIIHHQAPTPVKVETATLNEYAAAYLASAFVHVWDALKYGGAEQAVMAFTIQVRRLNEEWAGP